MLSSVRAWAARRYSPARRLRLARFTGVVALLLYSARSLQQLVLQPLPDRARVQTYDFGEYMLAARQLNAGRDLYQSYLSTCGHHEFVCGYIYPPLLAELFRPLVPLGDAGAARVWLVVSQACILGTVVLLLRALPALRGPGGWLLLAGSLLFLPLFQSLYSLQVGAALALLLTAATVTLDARPLASGSILGVAGVLRVTPVVAFPALLVRRRFLPAAAAMTVAGLALLAALWLLTPYTMEYFTRVLPALGTTPPLLENQSLPGFLARAEPVLGIGQSTLTRAVALVAAAAILLGTLAAAARSRTTRPGLATMTAMVAAMPIVSALTWQHHLAGELPVMAVALGLTSRPGWTGRVLAVAYPLLWVDRHVTDPLAALLGLSPHGWTAAPYLLVTSLNLLGMLLVWVAALDVLRRP